MIRIVFIVCCVVFVSEAQVNLSDAQRKLDLFNQHFKPEFIDIMLDRDFYFSGDRIWYSLFLSNYGNTINGLSAVAYVEIRDEYDSVLVRQKLRCRDGRSHGDIRLPRNMPTGLYKISAYTLWMKNIGTVYNSPLTVINLDNPLIGITDQQPQQIKSILTVEEDADEIQLSVTANAPGILLVRDRSEVYALEKFSGIIPLKINLTRNSLLQADIFATVLDSSGVVLEEHLINRQNESLILITSNRSIYKPGDKVELTITLQDEFGNLMNGSVSLVVRSGGIEKKQLPGISQSGPLFLTYPLTDPAFSKEKLIYPGSPQSLLPINFRIPEGHSRFPLYLTDTDKKEIEQQGLKRKIMDAYQADVINDPERNFIIPYDNAYRIGDYAQLQTIEEFIREIVPQVRIKRSKAEKMIRVRNSDDPNRIYYYEDAPLILINDRIASEQGFLSLQCQDVERVDVLWSTNKINSLAIFSLADNGVVSVRTKSDLITDTNGKFLEGIHTPLTFSNLKPGDRKEGEVPLFFEPVYWNPEVPVNGKTTINFNLSNVPGDFTVEVTGYNTKGQRIYARTIIKVN